VLVVPVVLVVVFFRYSCEVVALVLNDWVPVLVV